MTGDTEFPPLAPPSRQQSISLSDVRRSTPPQPPGLEGQAVSESRRSTPTVPPGITKPAAVLDHESASGSRPSSRAGVKRAVSQITPALPLRPATPALPTTSKSAVSQQGGKAVVTGETPGTPKREWADVESKKVVGKDVEELPYTPSIEADSTTSQPALPEGSSNSAQEAALNTESSNDVKLDGVGQADKNPTISSKAARLASSTVQPAPKDQATVQASDTQASRQTPTKQQPTSTAGTKRTPPGRLDIAAAARDVSTDSTASTAGDTGTPARTPKNAAQTPIEAPSLGSPNGGVSTPTIRGPKTLRVVSTPKTETTPSTLASTPADSTPTTARQPSPQLSIASIQVPGTPSSEHVSISDVSVPSTSQSRASSPPPPLPTSKASSGPAKTKNQLKKERQERAKAIEEEKKAEEPAQEAIVSRKKKSKREKETKPKSQKVAVPTTEQSTPTASRAPSPPPQPVEEEAPAEPEPTVQTTKSPEPPAPVSAPTPPIPAPQEPSPPPTPTITAAQIIADLKATTPEIQKCLDSLFRSPTSTHYKATSNITAKDLENEINGKGDFVLNLTLDEIDGLLKGSLPALCYGGSDNRTWSRGMVTPTGAHLRALAEELETRFLELEKAIHDLPNELRFRPTKPQNDMRLPSFDLEALRRNFENLRGRSVSVMEQMMQDGAAPRSGVTIVDDVEKYINAFVVPPATPPPGAGTGSGAAIGVASGGAGRFYDGAGSGQGGEVQVPSVDIAEWQLNEARRVGDEREGALKKMMKKNRKVLGLSG